ncbi:MAG: CaiB/BaiF CoA transferase family protein [Flavobacteriaceae bacterium]
MSKADTQETANRPVISDEDRPLAGVVVLETSSFLTGPYASMMLADLGAEVIKVEPPEGDGFRRFGYNRKGFGATWTNANRSKKSIVIDLKQQEGLSRLKQLVKKSDILLENWRPGVAEKLGLGQDVVTALNPKIIRISITGFGDKGPLVKAPALDSLIQGRTGLIAAEGRHGNPSVTPFNMVDKVVAAMAAQAVLAALYKRDRTGKGAYIQLPMLDALAYFNFPDMFQHRTFENDTTGWKPPQEQVLQTSDGHIVISPVNGKQMSVTLNAIERAEWKEELKKMPDPVAMAADFFRRVGEVVKEKPSAFWLKRFAEYDVPASPVYGFDEFLADEQVRYNEIFQEIPSPVGPIRAVRYPALFDDARLPVHSGPPSIGEHDKEVGDGSGIGGKKN